MSYLLLLITIAFIWAVVYPLTNYALLSPPSLILLMFAFATALSMIGQLYWNEIELNIESYFVILAGCLGVLAAAIISRGLLLYSHQSETKKRGISTIEKIADLSDSGWYMLSLFVLISATINIVEMISLSQAAGFSSTNIMEIAQWARGNTSTLLTAGTADTENYSVLSSMLTKIITFCGYVSVIGIAAKIKNGKRTPSDYASVVVLLILTSTFSLLKGGRDTIAHYGAAFIIVLFAFYILDSENRQKTSLQFLKVSVIALIIALPLFYFALELVGRLRSVPLFDYISFYLGGGIPSLSYVLDNPPLGTEQYVLGERTFTQLYALLDKVGFAIPMDSYAGDFIKLGNHSSNIFTAFYRYYFDFGYIGVFILSGLATLIFSACFQAVEKSPHIQVKIVALYICSYAVDIAREEFIFSRLLSASILWAIIAAVIIGAVLVYSTKGLNYKFIRKGNNR